MINAAETKKITLKRTRLRITAVAVVIMWIVGWVPSLQARIYTYIDNKGNLYFSNEPARSSAYINIRKVPSPALRAAVSKHYDYMIAEAALAYNVPFSLIKAIIKVESDYNPKAVSSAGAKGLMQLMPVNIKAYGVKNPFDPRENIMAGTRYFNKMVKRFEGKLTLALAAYNAGPTRVEKFDAIPPYQETQAYVRQVMSYYYVLKKRR